MLLKNVHLALLIPIVMVIMTSCSDSPSNKIKNENTMLSGKAIYGDDDRKNPQNHSDEILRKYSESVVLLTRQKTIPIKNNGFCSGSIVNLDGKIFVMTAGHCVEKTDRCDDIYFIRNFEDGTRKKQIQHRCRSILFSSLAIDLAILEIDETTTKLNNLPSISLDLLEKTEIGTPLAIIGHPEGGPQKITDNCNILEKESITFQHRCDTFSGNSGSPVFELNGHRLIGILISGRKDKTNDGSNIKYKYGSENTTNLEQFIPFIKNIINKKNTPKAIWNKERNMYLLLEKNIKISCQFLSLPDEDKEILCEQTALAIFDVIQHKITDSTDLSTVKTFYVEDRWSDINSKTHIDIKAGASSEEILEKIIEHASANTNSTSQKSFSHKTYLDEIRIECENPIPLKKCLNSVQLVIDTFSANPYFNKKSLNLSAIYISEKTYIFNNWIDISMDATSDDIYRALAKRNRFIDSDDSSIEFIIPKRGLRVTSLEENISCFEIYYMENNISTILMKHPEYNSISLDMKTIYVQENKSLSSQERGNTTINYSATKEEIEDIFRMRYTPQ